MRSFGFRVWRAVKPYGPGHGRASGERKLGWPGSSRRFGALTSSGSDDGGAGPRLLNDAAADLAPCAPSGNLFYLDLVESSELGPSGPQLYANPGFDVFAVPYAFQVMPGAYAPGPILAVTAPEGTSPVPGSYPLDGNQSSWPSVKVTSGAVECLPQSGSIDLLELPVLSQQDEDGGTKILLSFDILCAGAVGIAPEIRGCVRLGE